MSMATIRTKDSFEHWWDPEGRKNIILNRRSLRISTQRYLEKVPLLDGVPVNYEQTFVLAATLSEIYIRLVKGELAHHNGEKDDALWTGMLFGPLFSLMWTSASSIRISSVTVPSGIDWFGGSGEQEQLDQAKKLLEIAKRLPEYNIVNWIDDETMETAQIFARAYVKAFAEFAFSCAQQKLDSMVIRHHSAVLAEIISDMLNLVVQGGEPTDLRLPDGHLHKKIAIEQESARAASAETLRNVSLGRQ